MRRRSRNRTESGGFLAEFAASMVIGLPLLVCIVFISLEVCRFYTIKSAMEVGARTAARSLVVNYNRTQSQNTTVSNVTMPNYIASSDQFNVTWDTASPPSYVTVQCTYPTDGSNGLLPFPAGPLKFLSAKFDISKVQVSSTFTFPIQ